MSTPSAPNIKTQPLARVGSLRFQWYGVSNDGGSPITGYRFNVNPGGLTYSVGPDERFYTISSLTNALTYNVSLQAQNAFGYGPPSAFRPFQAGSPPTLGPSTATAVLVGSNSALVSWTPPAVLPDATIFWYTIQSYSTNISDPVLRISANALTQSNYFIKSINPNSFYSFAVRAVNCPGYSRSTFTNTITNFSPSSIDSMITWYDAADSTTITISTNRVVVWADKSGRGGNATGTTSTGPTYTPSNVTYGSGQTMSMNIPFTSSHSVFFVATKNTGSGGSYTFYRTLGPSLSPAILTYPSGTNQVYYYNFNDTGIFAATADPQFIASYTYSNKSSASNTGRVVGYYNGNQVFSSFQNQLDNGGSPYNRLGDGNYFGSMKEILVYSTILSSTNISYVHSYLKGKWGI
jgi:hypothetical protein